MLKTVLFVEVNMTASSESSINLEQWDLTSRVSPYLDRHMIFPLLEYVDTLIAKNVYSYSSQDVAKARLSLLKPTHMVDYAIDVYKSLNDAKDVPKEMEEQKQQVFKELEELQQGCAALDKLCQDEEERVSHEHVCSNSIFISSSLSHKQYSLYHLISSPNWWPVDSGMPKPCKKSTKLHHK